MIRTLGLVLILFLGLPVAAVQAEQCEETRLGEIMQQMKGDLKAYTKAVKQDDKAVMQSKLESLLMRVESSRMEVPQKYQDVDDAMDEPSERESNRGSEAIDTEQTLMPDYLMDYQERLDRLEQYFKQLQNEDDPKAVRAILKQIEEHTKASHREHKRKCD